jgi:hypothetical protein
MAVTNETSYENRVTQSITGRCGDSQTESSVAVRYFYEYSRDHPGRTRPSDLIANPTFLGYQRRLWADAGKETSPTVLTWNYCDWPPIPASKDKKIVSYAYPLITSEYGSAVPGPWEVKIRLKIKDQMVNLASYIAEYRETANMFKMFATTAHSAYQALRGRSGRRNRRLNLCNVAAGELLAQYGIRPLMNDLADSVLAFNEAYARPLRIRVATTTRNDQTGSNDYWDWTWTQSDRAIAYVTFTPGVSSFTAGNLAEIAWEAIPFSFIADWGIPIGDYLSSLDALNGVTGVNMTVTTKKLYEATQHSPYNAGYTLDEPGSVSSEYHARAVYTSVPMPRVPRWQPSLSYQRIINAVSLLTVLNSRCR